MGLEKQHVLWAAIPRYQSMAVSSGHLPLSFILAVREGSSKGIHDGSVWRWSAGVLTLGFLCPEAGKQRKEELAGERQSLS